MLWDTFSTWGRVGRGKSLPAVALLIVLGQLVTPCYGGNFPDKPLRWIIGYPPGGASDVLVRVIAQELASRLGERVVVDNRPGATGILAATLATQAPADGYTLFLSDVATLAINQALYRRLPYRPADLSPVTSTGVALNVVIIAPAVRAASIPELIAVAKENPKRLNYASGGSGTITHIATELFKEVAHVDLTHIPFKGTPPALLDLVANRVDVMFAGLPPALPFIQSGKLRAIAVTTEKRISLFPELPTVAETLSGYEATTWYGISVPRGTPQQTVAVLNKKIRAAMAVPHIRDRLVGMGFDMFGGSTPSEFARFIKGEEEKYAQLIKKMGLKVD